MGLMQVLPATGASVAKSIGLTGYGGADSLYDWTPTSRSAPPTCAS